MSTAIKVPADASYADTVNALRAPGTVAPADIASVSAVKKTREGHVLRELKRTAGAEATVTTLSKKIAENLSENAAAITAMGQTTELKIVDLDAAATREEVLAALVQAAADNSAPLEVTATISVTGLWSTKIGQQVTTAVVPAVVVPKITRVPIGNRPVPSGAIGATISAIDPLHINTRSQRHGP